MDRWGMRIISQNKFMRLLKLLMNRAVSGRYEFNWLEKNKF